MQLLQPEYLKTVEGLSLLARSIVNSYYAGQNQSRRNGTGQEFSQYRSYQPGDDIRLLDWKLYARSDRYYIREAEIETNIEVTFLLDASASMLHEEGGIQKLDYARLLIATLAWLAQRQGDWISLYALNEEKLLQIQPKPGRQFFSRFLHELLQVQGKGKFPKSSRQALNFVKKGQKKIIIFITDMYQETAEISNRIRALNLPHHELILFQIMGQKELSMEYGGAFTFEDLETGATRQVNSSAIKEQYQQKVAAELSRIKQEMLQQNVMHHLFKIPENPGEALKIFLKQRAKLL